MATVLAFPAATLASDVDRFLTHLETERGASPNTVMAYRNDLSQLRSEMRQFSCVAWTRLAPEHLTRATEALRAGSYAPATIARKLAAFKSFFRWLGGMEWADRVLEVPAVERAVPHVLTAQQVEALLAAPRLPLGRRDRKRGPRGNEPLDVRDAAILRLLYATGVRVSELVGLDVGDVHLASDYLRVAGRGNRERTIPFDLRAHRSLADYLDWARPALGAGRTEALFVNHHGQRLTRQGCWLMLHGHAQAAGLPTNVTPRVVRHSMAVHLLAGRADLGDVSRLLGHVKLTTTQPYATVAAQQERAAAVVG